jgi:tRNA G46 methylase TrmB
MEETFASIEEKYGGMAWAKKFVDLGSGTGKGCLSAALLHPFQTVIGIELIPSLYDLSV